MINQKILDNMSENNDKISQSVNVHDPVNPPHAGFGINVKLKLLNQNCFSITNWKNGEQPSFTLEITDPISLGLENFQENNVDKFMDNVILACNLVLKRGAFSRHGSDSAHATIHRKKEPSIPSKVEDTPTGKKVTIQEVISITESIHIGIGFEDELDENQVIDVLKKIRKINDGTANSNLKIQDLQKSLRDYYSGTTSFDRLSIFKHLFSSLELATNCDGQDRAFRVVSLSGNVKNNIFVSLSHNQNVMLCNSPGALVMDNNVWWPQGVNAFSYNSSNYNTLVDYKNGTSQGINSIAQDPLFIDAGNNDFYLLSDSPCMNAGVDVGLSEDFDGKVISNPPEIGAYELDWLYLGDFTGDGDVGPEDLAVLAENWLQDNPAIDIAPYLDPDGVINFKEFWVLAAHWLEGTEL